MNSGSSKRLSFLQGTCRLLIYISTPFTGLLSAKIGPRFNTYQIQFKIVGVLGNTEEEENGYVVFKGLQQASGQIFKDVVNGFSSSLDI